MNDGEAILDLIVRIIKSMRILNGILIMGAR
jgi:hypothetical protein